MGLFSKLKKAFSGFTYKVDREILKSYLDETMAFSEANAMSFCDEFYIAESLDSKDRLHVSILNYDTDEECTFEIEETFTGLVIFANHDKSYNPETDDRFTDPDTFISQALFSLPENFYLFLDVGPVSLKPYEVE